MRPLRVVGKRPELKENNNPVWMRKSFYDNFHTRNHGHTMVSGCEDQMGQKNARFEGKKRLIILYISQRIIFVLCSLTWVSCQWNRWEAEMSKERLSLWYLQPIQKNHKSLIKAWLLCVLLSPFTYWESYFVSSSFLEFLIIAYCIFIYLNFPYLSLVCKRKLHWFDINWLFNWYLNSVRRCYGLSSFQFYLN